MSHRLDGIGVKIERAEKQIQNLNSQINDFLGIGEHAPYTLTVIRDSEQTILAGIEGPSDRSRIAVVTGEIIHHLRACYDHLVWQLVLEHAVIEPHYRHEFPVFVDRDKYITDAPRKVEGITDTAKTLIEREQPYHRPARAKEHPLWEIHELDRVDKHRMLIETHTKARFDSYFLDVHLAKSDTPPPLPLTSANREVKMRGQPTIDIVLEQRGRIEPLIPYLINLVAWTRSVMGKFKSEFR